VRSGVFDENLTDRFSAMCIDANVGVACMGYSTTTVVGRTTVSTWHLGPCMPSSAAEGWTGKRETMDVREHFPQIIIDDTNKLVCLRDDDDTTKHCFASSAMPAESMQRLRAEVQ
jgi:hypothetical protein